jgi:Archaeal/vacuolar-type H+-ATPase subunit E
MSKEAIIEKILSDADKKAESFLNVAKETADDILSQAAEQCKAYYSSSRATIDTSVKDIETRSKTVAEMDAKKLLLSAKAELLDKVYSLALEKVKNLDKEIYAALIRGMLSYAEDGDVITVSKREKDIVTEDFVSSFAKEKGIKLSLSKNFGDFDGGIILTGKGIDKNLTFEVELSLLRDVTEAEIAKELFG